MWSWCPCIMWKKWKTTKQLYCHRTKQEAAICHNCLNICFTTFPQQTDKRLTDSSAATSVEDKRPIRRVRSPSRPKAWLSKSYKPKLGGPAVHRPRLGWRVKNWEHYYYYIYIFLTLPSHAVSLISTLLTINVGFQETTIHSTKLASAARGTTTWSLGTLSTAEITPCLNLTTSCQRKGSRRKRGWRRRGSGTSRESAPVEVLPPNKTAVSSWLQHKDLHHPCVLIFIKPDFLCRSLFWYLFEDNLSFSMQGLV